MPQLSSCPAVAGLWPLSGPSEMTSGPDLLPNILGSLCAVTVLVGTTSILCSLPCTLLPIQKEKRPTESQFVLTSKRWFSYSNESGDVATISTPWLQSQGAVPGCSPGSPEPGLLVSWPVGHVKTRVPLEWLVRLHSVSLWTGRGVWKTWNAGTTRISRNGLSFAIRVMCKHYRVTDGEDFAIEL